MNHRKSALLLIALLLLPATSGADETAKGKPLTVTGSVIDSACAFTKGLNKPISTQCATACAKAGSPLVILADDGRIYWPISEKTPASGQNERLLAFAGKRVTVTGKAYQRGGSMAIAIEKVTLENSKK